jgi:glycosyltransferase involved in cell wall biosynthesis
MLDPYFKRRFPLKHLKKMIYWHLFLQRVLRGATTLLFTCEEEKVLARQSFLHYRVREMVVPYGIFGPDCDKAAGVRDFLKNWPGLKGKRMAISMGRINPKKGTDILIRAFAATLANDPLWRLVIAGPDEKGLRNSLTSLAESLGVADRVTWTGMLKDKMKWGALASAEVFVLPSHQENFGIVVAEALASGLPVIISDKVNIWREVANRWAGLICDDTLEGTTTALRRWQSLSADEIAALRIRSKKCFDELFNYETTAKSALEIVEFVARQQR